jgi:CO/xanthine dehydrogenase Mo-binding subunit
MNRFGIGQVRRVEDARFITGRGQYVADIDLPGMAHGQVVLSPHAHADHAYRRPRVRAPRRASSVS